MSLRLEALKNGRLHYFTGKPCKRGHIAPRCVARGVCTECHNLRTKIWAQNNAQYKRDQYKRWAKENPEKAASGRVVWRSANPFKVRAMAMNSRAKRLGIEGKVTARDVERAVNIAEGLCAYCRADVSETFSIDHKTPLSIGGENVRANIHIVCGSCNSAKHTLSHDGYLEKLKLKNGCSCKEDA